MINKDLENDVKNTTLNNEVINIGDVLDETMDEDTYHKGRQIYDNIFKTLATRRSYWLIPLINELFSTDFPENCDVKLMNETHYIKRKLSGKRKSKKAKGGTEVTNSNDGPYQMMSDCIFSIDDELFHIELQSTYDGCMIIRVAEYDFVTALEAADYTKGDPEIEIDLPHSVVIYIKPDNRIPDSYKIKLKSEDESMYHKVKIMKFDEYGVEEIITKKLFILLPFYIARYEDLLSNGDISITLDELKKITKMLMNCYEDGIIQNTEASEIENFIAKLIKHLTHTGEQQERLMEVMTGEIIETTASQLEDANKMIEQMKVEYVSELQKKDDEIQELKRLLELANKAK